MQIDGSRPKFIVGKVYRNTGETVHFLPQKAKHAIPVCRISIAESTASRLALPRREQYFWPSGQIYAEAESNANEFALACFNRSGSMFQACFARRGREVLYRKSVPDT